MTNKPAPKERARTFVEDRLIALKTLKDKHFTDTKIDEYKKKANIKEVNAPGANDFRTQISAVVKLQKDADLKNAIPEYNFIPENDTGRKNRKIVKEVFNYWWLKTNTDKVVNKVIKSATSFGTGIEFEGIKHVYKTINTPYFNENNELEFKKEKKLIYSGIETRKVEFANFYINGLDIDTATECIEVRYFDKDQYISEKIDDPLYKNIASLKNTTKEQTFTGGTTGQDVMPDQDDEHTLTELVYYNVATDTYIIVANGVEILKTHIPYEHKELPYCLYYDNLGEDRIWGIGEFELLEEDEKYKNELRTLLVQGVKASIGFIMKEKDNDIEEEDINFGIGEIYEVSDIEGIKHFAPNTPINAIVTAEQMVDASIIQKSGVDINALQTTPETATKTAGKTVSGKKRINDNIKDNAYDFFRRLAYLRLKNIQFLHTMKIREIPIKGGSILNDGVFERDESGAYGSAKIGKSLIAGDFLVVPIIETMIGDNEARRRSNAERYTQLVLKLNGADGKPVIKGEALAELMSEEYGYDHDKMTQAQTSTKSGKDLIAEAKNKLNGVSTDSTNPQSPDYIPPEQRSGASKGGLSGQAKISAEEIVADL